MANNNTEIGKNVEEAPSLPSLSGDQQEILKLWTAAGGRCEFPGCNKYLLENEFLGYKTKIADVAHIAGRKKTIRSPRGLSDIPVKLRNMADNLMLLCSEHHNEVIDKPSLIASFPEELLRKYKKEHEDRVRSLTGMHRGRRTVVISLLSIIRGHKPVLPHEEMLAAIHSQGRYPELYGSEYQIPIDLTTLSESHATYWQDGARRIDEFFVHEVYPRYKRNPSEHFSVMSLARIPFLVYMGFKLGDKIPADIYQPHVNQDEQTWVWPEREGATFEQITLQQGTDVEKVAVIMSLSGKISLDELPANIDHRYTIYEVKADKEHLGRSVIESKVTLRRFRAVYQNLLRGIERDHTKTEPIQLFAAVPITAAIVCGREVLRKITPPITIYDREGVAYTKTLTINF